MDTHGEHLFYVREQVSNRYGPRMLVPEAVRQLPFRPNKTETPSTVDTGHARTKTGLGKRQGYRHGTADHQPEPKDSRDVKNEKFRQ